MASRLTVPIVLAAALALAGCAGVAPSGTEVPKPLQRYAEAASFLLPGFESVALYTETAWATEPEQRVLVAFCGSDFEAPVGVGYGRYRGIEVIDFGPSGVPEQPIPGVRTSIGDVPVFHHRHEVRPDHVVETWIALVEDRFVVTSHQRDLLQLALRRAGRLDELLRPFAAISMLTEDAESVVCLLPRPIRTAWDRLVPIEPMVVSLSASLCLRLYHRDPLPEPLATWTIGWSSAPPTTTTADGWRLTSSDLRLEPPGRTLLLLLLTGRSIFI